MTRTMRIQKIEHRNQKNLSVSFGERAKDTKSGELQEEFEKVLGIVQQAHQVAIDMVKPGVSFADIAQAARKVIEDTGYGDFFTHSLGHGV